jgi:hypothetical protein
VVHWISSEGEQWFNSQLHAAPHIQIGQGPHKKESLTYPDKWRFSFFISSYSYPLSIIHKQSNQCKKWETKMHENNVYTAPDIIYEGELEVQAGSPVGLPVWDELEEW